MASSASPSAAFSLSSFINHSLNHSFIPTLIHSLIHSLAAFRVAGALYRASWRSCGGRGRRWAAAGFAWQAQYRELPGCLSRGRRSTQSLLEDLRPRWAAAGFAWQAQYRELAGCLSRGAVHRALWRSCGARGRRCAAAGSAWQAQYREHLGCLSRGRRNTQSLVEELRRVWAPLDRGWLCVAGAVQRASWVPYAWPGA